jgi:DNA-binding winged helix-turn-helix (wHTH) protein/tetratricopeptide (TPR) repeat protein
MTPCTTVFGGFSLDGEIQRLSYGDCEIPLRAKSFAVLSELVRRRGRLVTKDELFAACWPNTAVSQTVLRVCIAEIRAALAADGTGSIWIESVGRRGYRLRSSNHDGDPHADPPLGRVRELTALRRALRRARDGQRQMVFVTGEAGLGKTTLLEHFVEEARTTSRARVGWGQCVELARGIEPYLPVLDLLDRLCADDPSGAVISTLERWAPSWLLQMPALIDGARAEALARRVKGTNRDPMLRELGQAFEALAADDTLILVIEDLHWTDFASGDVLAYLAQHTTPARMLVLVSYRPSELEHGDGPLKRIKQGLVAHRGALEIPLAPLTRDDVEASLVRRLTGAPIHRDLGRSLHEHTKGNPLFLTATVDYLLDRGILSARTGRWEMTEVLDGIVPDGLRQLALRQIERLDPLDRRVLEAACIVGAEFTVASVAAATGTDHSNVDDVCTRLASQTEFVSASGVTAWPDGTVSGQYEFRHVLYRDVLEEALPLARRRLLHHAIGQRLEAAWGQRSADISAKLAVHFESAGDEQRAIGYHIAAAKRARSRFAEREAVAHFRAALEHLGKQPASIERMGTELSCLLELGAALTGRYGPASGEVLAAFSRALALAQKLNVPQARFGAQTAIYGCLALRADLHCARQAADTLLASAEHAGNPLFKSVGHVSLGFALFHLGEFASAQSHFAEAHALWRPDFPPLAFDPSILARGMLGFCALIAGKPVAAADWIRSSVAHAEALNSPYNLSYAHQLAAQYYATAAQRELALEHAAKALSVAGEYGYVTHEQVATIMSGWARRDVVVMRQGIARYEGAEQYAATSLFRALVIETLLDANEIAGVPAELTAAFAFVERSGERRHLPELHRLRGEYLRRVDGRAGGSSPADARACFERALALAREQDARLWELRAAVSLADLLALEGLRQQPRELLETVVRPFAAASDLPDVRRAHALLAAL